MAIYYYNPDASGANNGTSEADGWTAMSSVTGGVAAGDTVYFKNGASRDGSGADVTFATDASDTTQIRLKGYSSTIEDDGLFLTNDKFFFNGSNHRIENFDVNNALRPTVTTAGENNLFQNCKIVSTDTADNGRAIEIQMEASLIDCYIENTDSEPNVAKLGAVYVLAGDGVCMQGCVVRGHTGLAINNQWTSATIVTDCIFTDATNKAMNIGIETDVEYNSNGHTWIANNTFYGFTDSGIQVYQMSAHTDHKHFVVMNNVFWGDNSGSCIGIENEDTGQTSTVHFIKNAFGNVAAPYDGFATGITGAAANHAGVSDITLTADPFVNGAAMDFRLNGAGGGGALLRAESTPTAFRGTTGANRKDLGAMQHSGLIERISVS